MRDLLKIVNECISEMKLINIPIRDEKITEIKSEMLDENYGLCEYDGSYNFDIVIDERLLRDECPLKELKEVVIHELIHTCPRCLSHSNIWRKYARKTIYEGVRQVLRRAEICKKDWDKIRRLSSIDLPEKPHGDDKIIKVVCTDIYDFTSLVIKDVIITDDSTLLKYMTNPVIKKIQIGSNKKSIESVDSLWKMGRPTVQEFINQLERPNTVIHFLDSLEEKQMPIVYYKDENYIVFKNWYLKEDPFLKMATQKKEEKYIQMTDVLVVVAKNIKNVVVEISKKFA